MATQRRVGSPQCTTSMKHRPTSTEWMPANSRSAVCSRHCTATSSALTPEGSGPAHDGLARAALGAALIRPFAETSGLAVDIQPWEGGAPALRARLDGAEIDAQQVGGNAEDGFEIGCAAGSRTPQ